MGPTGSTVDTRRRKSSRRRAGLYRVPAHGEKDGFTVCRHTAKSGAAGLTCRFRPSPSSSGGGGSHAELLPCTTIFGTRQRALYRAGCRRVLFTVCSTRESLCRVFSGLCRVSQAHGNEALSRGVESGININFAIPSVDKPNPPEVLS